MDLENQLLVCRLLWIVLLEHNNSGGGAHAQLVI